MSAFTDFTDNVYIPFRPNFLGGIGNRFLPPNEAILELGWLRTALRHPRAKVFIPERIIIREEMETAFRELLHQGYDTLTVFSGSPGIGKSVLLFVVALFRVVTNDDKVAYLRRTDDTVELVSVVAMMREANGVSIRFSRKVPRTLDAAVTYEKLCYCFDGVDWTHPTIVAVADGPKPDALDRFSLLTYACTSGVDM